jgi:hypothetical protein
MGTVECYDETVGRLEIISWKSSGNIGKITSHYGVLPKKGSDVKHPLKEFNSIQFNQSKSRLRELTTNGYLVASGVNLLQIESIHLQIF